MEYFQKNIVPPMVKMAEQRHLRAIRGGLYLTIPFIIIGSFFLIIANLPFEGWSDFLGDFGPKLGAPVGVTFGILAVITAIGIGYNLAKEYQLNPISGGAIALVGFMVTQVNSEYKLIVDNFGSSGLFTAIVISLLSIEVYKIFVDRNIIIHLPEGVPPAVMNSFASLVPGAGVVVLIWLIRVVLGFDITQFLALVFSPLVFALNTLPGILFFEFFVCLLWTVGIHGDNILGGIAEPIFLQYLAANTAAYMAHQPIPYITGYGFHTLFVALGGTGATIALVILMMRSKDKAYKSLGKLAFPSAIFEINEPVIFGFPIVLNPTMMIPFILTPMVLCTATYFLMDLNILARPVAVVPWTMIPIIGPFLVTGGDIKAAIWGAISIVISIVIYYPFFKSAERAQLANEIEIQIDQTKTM